jgi:hypothetical protein
MKQKQINFSIEINYNNGRDSKNEIRNLTTDVDDYESFVKETIAFWNLKNPYEEIKFLNILSVYYL